MATESLDTLPSAIVATIMAKLDVASICSCAATCTAFRALASHILSFIPSFHLTEIAPSMDLLRPLVPPTNRCITSLTLDCARLDDSAIPTLLRGSLRELSLLNCFDFTGKLLSQIGHVCKDLRSLCLGSVAAKRGRAIHISDLEELLGGCVQLETLALMFDVSLFLRPNFARIWSMASENLVSLEIGDISSVTVTELLSPNMGFSPSPNQVRPSILPSIQKLCLCVDYITDTMVTVIAKGLISLTHLELRDAPLIEPSPAIDLTNSGLQEINQYGRLKNLSLIRSQEYIITYFRRVNDLGLLLMADKCAEMESICFGGFCRVTDTGFKTIFHSCPKLHKLKVTHGTQLTDLIFHDIAATPLSLVHVSLRWCSLLTDDAVASLASNKELKVLDLRCCRNLGDEALRAIGTIPKLKALLLDNTNVSDDGLSFLRPMVAGSLVSLSLRGCKKLTDGLVSALFEGCSATELKELDLSNLKSVTDEAVMSLARLRVPLAELRLRQCPQVGDASVMALASMQVDDDMWHGNGMRVLDLYNCGGVTGLSFKWLKRPYFPRLRRLGVNGSSNRNIVDALARNRPFLNVASHGEEIGAERWDNGPIREYAEEYDELERWLLEGEIETEIDDDDDDDEEMVDFDEEME